MSYSYPGTPDKGADYMVEEFLALHGVEPDLKTMKAFARGILKALSEDETGFNQPPGDAGTVSGGLVGDFVLGDGLLIGGSSSVNASSGSINLNGYTFNSGCIVLCQGVNTEKIKMTGTTSTTFSWATTDGSTFNGIINWLAFGAQ